MVKKITIIILLVSMLLLLCGCNSSTENTKAYIKINEKMIVVDVKECQFVSSGVVIIYDTDGKMYKTHFVNVVLVKDAEGR